MITKQPFFLNATNNYWKYEYNTDGISHFYAFIADGNVEQAMGIPDDCVDILYHCNEDDIEIIISGTGFSPRPLILKRGDYYFGIRFLPGFIPEFHTISFSEILGNDEQFEELLRKDRTTYEIISNQNFIHQIKAFIEMYYQDYFKESEKKNSLSLFTKNKMIECDGFMTVKKLAQLSGYSEKYVIKTFKEYYGMTPKKFAEILQFQKSMQIISDLANKNMNFMDVAVESNYYDESHMLRAFRKNINMTPKNFEQFVHDKNYIDKIKIEKSDF